MLGVTPEMSEPGVPSCAIPNRTSLRIRCAGVVTVNESVSTCPRSDCIAGRIWMLSERRPRQLWNAAEDRVVAVVPEQAACDRRAGRRIS